MCKKLVQEYKEWLGELLEILGMVCEDVVPAGRLSQDIYWRTRELYETAEELERENGKQKQQELLEQYAEEGRSLLEQVKAAAYGIREKNVNQASGKESCSRSGNGKGETEWLPEEFRISFRREYANEILNSLQMLVNFAFLAEKYWDCSAEEISKLFETNTVDGVKRVRSGVVVGGENKAVEARIYLCSEKKSWKVSVAG